MREVVIVEGVRTPVGRRKGLLKDYRPDDLAGVVLKELVTRVGIDAALVEDVIFGCVTQSGEQAGDIARVAALIAGFPIEVPGTTLDRQCILPAGSALCSSSNSSRGYGYCHCRWSRKHDKSTDGI